MTTGRCSRNSLVRWLAIAAAGGLLTACTAFELAVDTTKRLPGEPEPTGSYKVGKPYRVEGQWYYPKVDYAYHERGLASWYGPNFHGKPTANGETFDMRKVSAAHKTLPLPSIVRVTNLENGRSLVLRVNDRGPFVRGRIIDLSQRAAELLGFAEQGTAKVDVRVLGEPSRQAALKLGAGNLPEFGPTPPQPSPSIEVTVERLNPVDGIAAETAPRGTGGAQPVRVASAGPTSPPPYDGMTNIQSGAAAPAPQQSPSQHPVVTYLPPTGQGGAGTAQPPAPVQATGPTEAESTRAGYRQPEPGESVQVVPVGAAPMIFVQAGAFARYDNANRLRARLTALGHPVKVTQIYITHQPMFRVRVGPLASVEMADRTLDRMVGAGYPDAHIVID